VQAYWKYVEVSKCSLNHFLFPSEEYNRVQSLSYISFKVFLLCNYTLFLATVKVFETFLVAILWQPFQLFGSILNDVSSITKGPISSVDFCRKNRQKWAGASSEGYGGCSSVVTLFFAKKSLTKTDRCAGALPWTRNQLLVLHFPGRSLLTASLRRRRVSMWISLFTVAILQILPANSCKIYQQIPGTFRSYYV
jgi:hypothetical protein